MNLSTYDDSMGPTLLLRRTYKAYCKCGVNVSVFNIQRRGGICRECCTDLKCSFIIKRLWRKYRNRKTRCLIMLVTSTRMNIPIHSGISRIIYNFVI
jgi:hypothetical protein